jgi:hypothetical protein
MQTTCRQHADNMQTTCRQRADNMQATCRQRSDNVQTTYRGAINMLSTCYPTSVRPPVSPKATAALAGSGQATMRLSPGLPTTSLKSSTRMAVPVLDLLKYAYLRRRYYVHAKGYWERRSLHIYRKYGRVLTGSGLGARPRGAVTPPPWPVPARG